MSQFSRQKSFHPEYEGSILFLNVSNHFLDYMASHQELGQSSQYSDGLWAGWLGLDSWLGKIGLFSTAFTPTLGPRQPPIQWVPVAIFPG
jgi:hypothetical protein